MSKYPNIKVKLSGNSGNAFYIIGAIMSALRKGGVSNDEIDEFEEAATSGDYDNVLNVARAWVKVS